MATHKNNPPRRPRPVTKHDPRRAGPPSEGRRPGGQSGEGRRPGGVSSGPTRPDRTGSGHPAPGPPPITVVPGHEIIYGRNPVREALRGRRHVYRLWLVTEGGRSAPRAPAPDAAAPNPTEPRPVGARRLQEELRAAAASAGRPLPSLSTVPADILEQLTRSLDHQGVAAEVEIFTYRDAGDILAHATLILALDRVQDPHNLGAIIRTAEAAGAAVVIPRHRAAEVTPAVVKASAGASEHAEIARVRNLADFMAQAKEAGFWVYGTAAEARQGYSAPDYRDRTMFVLGSEGEGLGRRVEQACDQLISIPLRGRVGSLNVSVSAGIVLYEAVRQREEVARAAGAALPRAADTVAVRRAGTGRAVTVYLIDGYNLLHALIKAESRCELGEILEPGRLEDERHRLLDRVASFMGGTKDRAVVVFDARKSRLEKQVVSARNVEVFFGSFDRSADSIIEREAYSPARVRGHHRGELGL